MSRKTPNIVSYSVAGCKGVFEKNENSFSPPLFWLHPACYMPWHITFSNAIAMLDFAIANLLCDTIRYFWMYCDILCLKLKLYDTDDTI